MQRSSMLMAASLVMALIGLTVMREIRRLPGEDVRIEFFDVGQGDAALITTPQGKQILIDGGPDWEALKRLGEFAPLLDRHIDLLVVSHANLDHYLSFPEILRRYQVDAIGVGNTQATQPRFLELLDVARELGVKILPLTASQKLILEDGVALDVLWPPRSPSRRFESDENNLSLVMKLQYGESSVLFTGDMEAVVEETLVKAGVDLTADILKVAHHGSETSSTDRFLQAVSPHTVVISVGKDNSYGHPRSRVLERLKKYTSVILRTDMHSTVTVMCPRAAPCYPRKR